MADMNVKVRVTPINKWGIKGTPLVSSALALTDVVQSHVWMETFEDLTAFTDAWDTTVSGSGEMSLASTGGVMGGKYLVVGDNSGNDQRWCIYRKSIPFDPTKLYRMRVRVKQSAGSGTVYFGVAGRNETDTAWVNVSGLDITGSQHYIVLHAATVGSTWEEHTGYFRATKATGESGSHANPSDPGGLHTNVRYFRPVFVVNYLNAAGTVHIDQITVDVMPYMDDIRGYNIVGSGHLTKGSYLTAAASAADSTLYLANTDDFASSGSAWIADSINDWDVVTWTGKSATTLTGCSGVLAHSLGAFVIPQSQGMHILSNVNEMRFVGDRGDGTYELLCSIGVRPSGADYFVIEIGSTNYSRGAIVINNNSQTTPLQASNYHADGACISGVHMGNGEGIGVNGETGVDGTGYGVRGLTTYGYGVYAVGASTCLAPLLIWPSSSSSAPSHSAAKGSLWVTSEGKLYINTSGSTTWALVGSQT